MAKFTLMLKMPDAGDDAIRFGLENGQLKESDVAKAKKLCKKFLEYDEYIYVTMDTDKGTATVNRSNA